MRAENQLSDACYLTNIWLTARFPLLKNSLTEAVLSLWGIKSGFNAVNTSTGIKPYLNTQPGHRNSSTMAGLSLLQLIDKVLKLLQFVDKLCPGNKT